MFLNRVKKYKLYGIIFLITLFIVLVVRCFFVQSYTVSTSNMETALFKGDRVFVSKISYGIRLPITLLSVPFTFDRFLGTKSYTDLIELNYRRLFKDDVHRNDIVLFNNPLETDKPIDKRSLVLSRCVGLPGDTIYVKGNDLSINGKNYIPSPDLLYSYRFPKEKFDSINSVMSQFNVPLRNLKLDSVSGYIGLNRSEMFIINQTLNSTIRLEPADDLDKEYRVVIPAAGTSVSLNSQNIHVFAPIIAQESIYEHNTVTISNSNLLINNEPISSYQFKEDYYWFISDNMEEGVDSRTLGFISEKFLIGKTSFIWFSSDNDSIRTERIFRFIK